MSALGALAIACDASLDLRKDQVVCYAIAAPRVGNPAFAAAYEARVPQTWNVINDQVRMRCIHVWALILTIPHTWLMSEWH